MTNEEIDRKSEIVTNALYRLKERDYITQPYEIKAIDDMLAVNAVALADLYDLIRFHAGPEA
jgi:hypothetical protein